MEIDTPTRLAANDFAYRRICREVERLQARGDARLLPMIESAAKFAWFSHPGRLSDGRLDNILLEAGRTLADAPSGSGWEEPLPPTSLSRTLHVASEVYVAGGHSRVLAKWVQRDLSSSPAIVVTRQPVELPDYLRAIAAERGVPIMVLDRQESILDRARRLRRLTQGFDRVVLHHHPYDAVPAVAYAKPGGCAVLMFNHAHFWFSLGTGVADMIVNTEPYFRGLSERFRFARATALLIGPPNIQPLVLTDVDKRRAKSRIGLSPEQPVVMTIGNEMYFQPVPGVDFFSTLAKLLSARPDLQVLVVGVAENSPLVPADILASGRVRLVGRVADPHPYYEAADLCLESFPMPSLGALVEAAAIGQAFPVPAFGEAETPARVGLFLLRSFAVRQPTEAQYIRYILQLIDAPEATAARAEELRRFLVRQDQAFGDQFAPMYEAAEPLGHTPREIPPTEASWAPENLVLASMTDPKDVSEALSVLLPLTRMGAAHAKALALGYERPRDAAVSIGRRLFGRSFRRLPEGLRRHVRFW